MTQNEAAEAIHKTTSTEVHAQENVTAGPNCCALGASAVSSSLLVGGVQRCVFCAKGQPIHTI